MINKLECYIQKSNNKFFNYFYTSDFTNQAKKYKNLDDYVFNRLNNKTINVASIPEDKIYTFVNIKKLKRNLYQDDNGTKIRFGIVK